jgi:MFS family permease
MNSSSRTLAAVLGSVAVASIPVAAMPVFVGYYADHLAYNIRSAGLISSAETTGMALGAIATGVWLVRPGVNLRRAMLAALGLFVVAQFLSIWPDHPRIFGAVRLVSGFAFGMTYAIGGLYIAALPKPDRGYALYFGLQFVDGSLGLWLLPYVFSTVGIRTVYIFLGALALMAMTGIGLLPIGRELSVDTPKPHSPEAPRPNSKRLLALVLLLSLFVNYIGNGGAWVLWERVGAYIGIPEGTRGISLALGMMSGIAGTALCVISVARMARFTGILIGHAALIISYVLPALSTSALSFLISAALLNASVAFIGPLYSGALARTDNSGRNVTIGVIVMGVGYGIGPGVLAYFLAPSGLNSFIAVATSTAILSLLLVIAALIMEKTRSTFPAKNGVLV